MSLGLATNLWSSFLLLPHVYTFYARKRVVYLSAFESIAHTLNSSTEVVAGVFSLKSYADSCNFLPICDVEGSLDYRRWHSGELVKGFFPFVFASELINKLTGNTQTLPDSRIIQKKDLLGVILRYSAEEFWSKFQCPLPAISHRIPGWLSPETDKSSNEAYRIGSSVEREWPWWE